MKAILLIFLLVVALAAKGDDREDVATSAGKDAVTSSYIGIIQQLQHLARDNHDSSLQPGLRSAIDALLPMSLSSEQLYRLGISTSLIAYPMEAGSAIPFDEVFYIASHRCARLLSDRTDAESVHYLSKMQPICGSDGGEHLLYEDYIAHQKKLRDESKSK